MVTAIDPTPAAASPLLGAEDGQDTSLIIMQSLLCLLRERGILSRADIEELTDRVRLRAAGHGRESLPCCGELAAKAAGQMAEIGDYIGRRYGGKHRRPQ